MKKKDFVKLLAENGSVTQKDADAILGLVFNTVTDVLVSGDEVSVPGFGKFTTAVRAARTCRNPQTGDQMEVPEKRVPKFKPATALKDVVLQ